MAKNIKKTLSKNTRRCYSKDMQTREFNGFNSETKTKISKSESVLYSYDIR